MLDNRLSATYNLYICQIFTGKISVVNVLYISFLDSITEIAFILCRLNFVDLELG